jgi:hypothetical protein
MLFSIQERDCPTSGLLLQPSMHDIYLGLAARELAESRRKRHNYTQRNTFVPNSQISFGIKPLPKLA